MQQIKVLASVKKKKKEIESNLYLHCYVNIKSTGNIKTSRKWAFMRNYKETRHPIEGSVIKIMGRIATEREITSSTEKNSSFTER